MNEVEREAVKLRSMLSAIEDWSPLYGETPEQHAQLIRGEAEMQVILTRLFRDMAKQADRFINRDHYGYQSRLDYNVEVIVNDDQIDEWDGTLINVTLRTVKNVALAGILASEIDSGITLGVPSTSELIQKLSLKEIAALVGKKVLDDGSIIDNPDPKWNVIDTVRKDIAQSVKTSLGLGETTDEAVERIREVINPVERAKLIAQTEVVNAYQAGVQLFGEQTNAVGKEWITAGATDICAQYAGLGPVPFNYEYGPGLLGPTAHPRCRCARRLIYREEWDALNK